MVGVLTQDSGWRDVGVCMVTPQGAISSYHTRGPWEGRAFRSDVEGVSVLVFGRAQGGDRIRGNHMGGRWEWVVWQPTLTVGVERLWRWVGTVATTPATVSMGGGTRGEVSESVHGTGW